VALSVYLLQSLVCVPVFFHFGLDLGRAIPLWGKTLLAFAFYGLEMLLARAWLRRYAIGPAEWALRSFTYRRRLSLR
jgi:uncharacterized protein